MALADRHDLDLDLDRLVATRWYTIWRAVTDGTLFDAMAAATCSASAPRWLLKRDDARDLAEDVAVDPVWELLLADVEDVALREHLAMSCVTAETCRFFGSYFHGDGYLPHWLAPVAERGRELVAAWSFGEGQGARAVFRFAPT